MKFFSERKGLEPPRVVQIDGIDQPLRNALWTVFYEFFFQDWSDSDRIHGFATARAQNVGNQMRWVWIKFFKEPSDSYPGHRVMAQQMLRSHFLTARWDRVYSLIEACFSRFGKDDKNEITAAANQVLEEENSAYRIIDGIVPEITTPEEVHEVQAAVTTKLEAVRSHLSAALTFLGPGEKRDYRNSAKESISAVESLCRLVGNTKSFDDGLKALRQKIRIHPALEQAFTKLYGYTSDEGGIRHALLTEAKVTGPEARFMLVSCSAFVNYIVSSFAENGQRIE